MVIHGEGSLDCVKAILDGAGVDYTEQSPHSVYVTGLQFNFWIFAQPERGMIDMITYEPLPEGVDELAALRCANAFNQKYIMVQFSVSECGKRLNGRYLLSFRDGLPAAALLRAARKFSSVFHEAVLGQTSFFRAPTSEPSGPYPVESSACEVAASADDRLR